MEKQNITIINTPKAVGWIFLLTEAGLSNLIGKPKIRFELKTLRTTAYQYLSEPIHKDWTYFNFDKNHCNIGNISFSSVGDLQFSWIASGFFPNECTFTCSYSGRSYIVILKGKGSQVQKFTQLGAHCNIGNISFSSVGDLQFSWIASGFFPNECTFTCSYSGRSYIVILKGKGSQVQKFTQLGLFCWGSSVLLDCFGLFSKRKALLFSC